MLVVESSAPQLVSAQAGTWWFTGWGSRRVVAGLTDRHGTTSQLLGAVQASVAVEAEQVHGASLAIVERAEPLTRPIAGCDALLTSLPGVALLLRTADCLPIFMIDPARGVVGLAHAGWRGLAASLPMRLVAAFRDTYHSDPSVLQVMIGPAIHACCYEVGLEMAARFGRHVRQRDGRQVCDLLGVAIEQLERAGVRSGRIVESRRCTGCEPDQWFSLRREGQAAGRLTSMILLRPSS